MAKKVGIVFPQIPFMKGGAELLVEGLKHQFKHRGYNAEIISMPFKWYPFEEHYNQMLMWRNLDLSTANDEEIDYVIGTKYPSYFVKHPRKITWLIHQERMAYDMSESIHSRFKDKPEETIQFRELDAKMLEESNKIFTISKNVSSRLKKYNGLDSEALYHPPSLHGRYYCNDYDNFIFSVGRLSPMKRLDLLIEAMRYTNKHIKAVIGGRGEEQQKLEALIEEYDLKDRVKLIGFVSDEDMLKLYAECMGVYFCPLDEDYGYITLEAFFSKKPVITAYDAGGVLEFVDDKKNGYITQASAIEIAKSIDQLYENKTKAKEMGNDGFNVVKNITWDNAMDQLIGELKKMDGKR